MCLWHTLMAFIHLGPKSSCQSPCALSFAVGLRNMRVIGPLLQTLLVPELCEISKDGQGSHRHKKG